MTVKLKFGFVKTLAIQKIVKLLAFYSRDVQELFRRPDFSLPCISVTREVFLRRTIEFSGPPIRMKLTVKAFNQKIPVKHCNQNSQLPMNYELMIPDHGHLSDDKQFIHFNSFNNYLSFINQECSHNAKCLISIPNEYSLDDTKKTVSRVINPVKLFITSSSSSLMSSCKDDYEQLIYPADRLKLPNLQMIITSEYMDTIRE
ncbi:hypothetical protein MN116_007585 [Schistosoma mekongi]|uniref:Uncharacterized protein n=1 Tax=Schistosoma mekongi TaxID=38744 RepID=A0AAE1Z7T3_SCHME|nr:hypothetical protein MN116_007585 [Schistosoma mekongi]